MCIRDSVLAVPYHQDLPLSTNYQRLPLEIQNSIGRLYNLAAERNVPVSFRVNTVITPEGAEVSRILFFRSDSPPTNGPANGSGGSSNVGGNSASGGRMPGSIGLTISLIGGSVAIVAYDRLLLQSLVDHDILPASFRTPALLSSLFVFHAALYRAGLIDVSLAQSLPFIPPFYGFQILTRLALSEAGMSQDSAVTDVAALTLAAMPFFLARQSATVASALGMAAGHSAEALAAASATRTAGVLRVGANFARVLGWYGMVDLGARATTWLDSRAVCAVAPGDYSDNLRTWDFLRLSQDIYNQEHVGPVLAGAFGMYFTFLNEYFLPLVYDPVLDMDYRDYYHRELAGIRSELIRGSEAFGWELERNIINILEQNTYLLNGQALPESTEIIGDNGIQEGFTLYIAPNWEDIQDELQSFYQSEENADNIGAGYDLVRDYTGPFVRDTDQLISLINRYGNIRDLSGLQEHLRYRLGRLVFEKNREIERRSAELGLLWEEDDGEVYLNPQMFNQEQQVFLENEGLRLSIELFMYQALLSSLE
jgi:hypothetical protein